VDQPGRAADADLALRVLADQPYEVSRPLVATIEEVRASATLAALAETLAGNARLAEGLAHTIREHDREHKTTYARTLLTYFSANSDIAVASRRLNVHPNTCRYRLARVEEIFGFSLNDPDERLLLWLQLRLADPRGRRGRGPA
jgi:DNA-binding PucR family transcriptional regulator